MKLPNGYGTVYKLSGTRRRPYAVKVRVGGKQKAIAYCATKEEGLAVLADYHKDPSLLSSSATFAELYRAWKLQKFPKLSPSSRTSYEISYKHCERLHRMEFKAIRFGHLQSVIDDVRAAGDGYCTQKKCRVLMEQLFAYAAKYDMVSRDYARYVEIDKHVRKYKKRPFTVRERNRLWHAIDQPGVIDVLVLIYTGLRIGEYLNLKISDIKKRQRCLIVTESKTEAGRGRMVPIHKKIWPYIEERLHANHTHICEAPTGWKYSYAAFRKQLWQKVMDALHLKHTPHETRHTCASMLDSAGANDTAVKMILGHAREGVTKKDYTHKTLRELRKAIDSI